MFYVAETVNEPPLINPIVSNLEVLGLSVLAPAPGVFTHVTLPALKSLTIVFGDIGDPNAWSHSTFLSFSSAFLGRLVALRLERPPISEDELIDYLRLFPSLARLILRDRVGSESPSIGDTLMTELTYSDDNVLSPCLCPNLEMLELSDVHACADERLADMVESRWRRQAPSNPTTNTVGEIIYLPL
jgi:hypothetical protein